MLDAFLLNFVADTKIIFRYDFVAPLISNYPKLPKISNRNLQSSTKKTSLSNYLLKND